MSRASSPASGNREPEAMLGLEDFVEPDDQGLSLDELSRAYAALLRKGADPYPEAGQEGQGSAVSPSGQQSAEQVRGEFSTASEAMPEVRGPDDEACPITPQSILEAILFVGHPSNEPLAAERIANLMRGVRPAEIDDLVGELNRQYETEGRPYTIVSVDLGYQLALRPQFAALHDALHGRIREARLSQSAIDVLAIVAYRQPITQPAIDDIRGKPCGAILSLLVRRDLLAVDRSTAAGEKPSFRTTDRFLELFDLDQLHDLPRSNDLDREL